MAKEARRGGVKYVSGESSRVTQLLFDKTSTCIGARCVDGSVHFADTVILVAGTAAGSLLDLKGQLVAKGHTVGYIQLSKEEVKKYKSIPIIDHLEGGKSSSCSPDLVLVWSSQLIVVFIGIVFPPQEDGIIKIGAVHFVTNYHKSHPDVSLPRYRSDNTKDGIPKPIETQLRTWLKEILPDLADREWFETRICW